VPVLAVAGRAIVSKGMKTRSIGLFLLARQNEYQRLQETSATAMAHEVKTPLDVHFSEKYVWSDDADLRNLQKAPERSRRLPFTTQRFEGFDSERQFKQADISR